MATLTKKRKAVIGKYDANKAYSVADASKIVKDITTTKFDASVDLAIRLGVDPRKANQMVRGTVTLPHGTGKTMRVLAIVTPDKEAEAKAEVLPFSLPWNCAIQAGKKGANCTLCWWTTAGAKYWRATISAAR